MRLPCGGLTSFVDGPHQKKRKGENRNHHVVVLARTGRGKDKATASGDFCQKKGEGKEGEREGAGCCCLHRP
uniref:Putative ovule protein n=1 Tax=Solanum chacoense TaxID=4108 RepID=A0A0V0GK92_SOLCH